MTSIFSNFFTKAKILTSPSTFINISRGNHGGKLESPKHKVDNLEKRFLVWTGKYKTIEEVPDYVVQTVVERARNRMRIKIANYMMAVTAVACIIMVISGKKAAERGESVVKQNLEWHKKLKEDEEKEKK